MSKQNGGIIGPNNIPTGAFGSASGVWKLSDAINYKRQGTWPVVLNNFQVDNSCRFETNTYMNKTASSGNTKTFTISFWCKRANLATGNNQFPISFYQDSSNRISVAFITDNTFIVYAEVGGSTKMSFTTNRVFRDISAWTHFVIKVDTTQGTEANRFKMYINGTQETSFSTATYPSQNDDLIINTNIYLGTYDTSNNFLSGYLAEFVYIDGTALDETSFGEFDSQTGIWVPKNVNSLTAGTNGFYLNFQDGSNLGNDVFGGTDLTEYNLTSIDQSIDSCTNNFATLNALSKGSDIALSNGNLSASNGNTDNSVLGNMAFANGKWYWEAKCTGATTYATIGITLASVDGGVHSAVDAGRIVYSSTGYIYREGLSGQGNISGVATFTTNDIVGITFNAQNGSVAFYKNGNLINTTVDSQLLYTNNQYINSVGLNQGSFDFNFGSPPYAISSGNVDSSGLGNFEYAVPEGFYSLCTKNLNLIG